MNQKFITARYSNCGNGDFGGFALAIVLVVTVTDQKELIDWTAYWGATPSAGWTEKETVEWVAQNGNKLSTRDAKYFSQGEDLPMDRYRP
jgi:hypothetical protein